MQKNLESNIWKYTVFLVSNKKVYVAILAAYYLTIPNITAQSIGFILLIESIAGAIFEIPSGYMSDKIGHKKTLILARIAAIVASVFFILAQDIGFLILGAVFLMLNIALFSGAGSAFMHETLSALNKENEYAAIMGKIKSVALLVGAATATLAPFLVSVSFKAPFYAAIVIDLIGLVAAIWMVNPPAIIEKNKENKKSNFVDAVKEGYSLGFFGYATFFGFLSGFLLTSDSFRAAYQMALNIPPMYYGLFFGAGRVLASAVSAFSGRIKEKTTIRSFMLWEAVIFIVLLLLIGLSTNPVFIIVLFVLANAVRHGLASVNDSYLVEILSKSKFKATLLSVYSQISTIVFAVSGFAVGFVINNTSYGVAYLVLSASVLVTSLVVYLYIKRKKLYKLNMYGEKD